MKTYKEVLADSLHFLNYQYVYGSNGEILSKEDIEKLAKQYPTQYTTNYLNKTLKNVGVPSIDCSALACKSYGIADKSSQMLYNLSLERGFQMTVHTAPLSSVLWKQGHVGLKINEDYQIEAKGVDYGVVVSKITSQKWSYALVFPTLINYFPDGYVTPDSDVDSIIVLQLLLNNFLSLKGFQIRLKIDGIWGNNTAKAVINLFVYKGWYKNDFKGYSVGENTIKYLLKL